MASGEPATVMQQYAFLPPEGSVILGPDIRSNVLAKLANARCELEDALNLSIPASEFDPMVIPEPLCKKLLSMIVDLKSVLRQIEGLR